MVGNEYNNYKERRKVLEFMRKNRQDWLSSDNIFNSLDLPVKKRNLITWLKRWEKMGILRRATVKEVINLGVKIKYPVHFSAYMWKWHDGAEDIGKQTR